MRCVDCNSQLLIKKNVKYHYLESGLDNVFLIGVTIYECPECRTTAVEIPSIRDLHLSIALHIVEQKEKLSGQEIRFLRKIMGMKAKDLAPKLGYRPTVFSRFENEKSQMGDRGDRLIRMWFLAQKEKEIKRYRECLELIDGFDQIGQRKTRTTHTIEIDPLNLLIYDKRKGKSEVSRIH